MICVVKDCLMDGFETQLASITTVLCPHHQEEAREEL